METKVKRREWVKTAAIIFLSVMLVLTFFSNTIMNRSLPEVAAQYVESGSINARIRGSGTVSANEVYEVSLSQTRKIRSVLVKVGQEVTAGDPLLKLESMESEELKAAQDQLETMELSYQKSLIEASNTTSTEDRKIQKLRDDYNEALRIYRLYSSSDPKDIEVRKKAAEKELAGAKETLERLEKELEELKNSSTYLAAKTELDNLKSNLDAANAQLAAANAICGQFDAVKAEQKKVGEKYNTNYDVVYKKYQRFVDYAGGSLGAGSPELENASMNIDYFMFLITKNGYTATKEEAEELQKIYVDVDPVVKMQNELPDVEDAHENVVVAEKAVAIAQEKIDEKQREISKIDDEIKIYEERTPTVAAHVAALEAAYSDLTDASSAAVTLLAAEEALEDALFQAGLGDSSNLDMQAAKDAIDEQKKLIEELTLEADGQEITANVSGVISAIHVTAGSTAGAEQPVIAITVADRGYTINIPVTNDQARQVRIGDTAQITNYYWGDITATLENIANDPASGGQGKMLIFRITGEGVEAGSNLTLSIGQKSANYDCLVPNSAIRSDSNGSFVLVVTSKSSPLGNRYVATRAEVQVLASDDTTSAVSGLANGDFVITTSTKPLEAGDLVRLPDNG